MKLNDNKIILEVVVFKIKHLPNSCLRKGALHMFEERKQNSKKKCTWITSKWRNNFDKLEGRHKLPDLIRVARSWNIKGKHLDFTFFMVGVLYFSILSNSLIYLPNSLTIEVWTDNQIKFLNFSIFGCSLNNSENVSRFLNRH